MKHLFSAAITLVLLVIYAGLVWFAIVVNGCISDDACVDHTVNSFTSNMSATLALVAGLVSALVVAELAITKSGEIPKAGLLGMVSQNERKSLGQIISIIYLFVWLVTGLAAFYFGFLIVEDDSASLASLSNLGQSWLGVAVGAAYAYFGLEQKQS